MAQQTIQTSIEIAATPARIWETLTDFENYPSWNPFLTSVKGDFAVGKQVEINAGGMQFKPTVLAFEPHREIRWLGHLWFKGLFDGEHRFVIIDNQDGTSTFKHEEQFNGLLVGLFAKKLATETTAGFEEMNRKLKALAEQE
ncbi:MAG: SRPBCC domain-containing protein [Bacteroidota bacterium]